MDAAIERIDRNSDVRIGFIDCNTLDAGMLAKQFQHVIPYLVEPLLADVLENLGFY